MNSQTPRSSRSLRERATLALAWILTALLGFIIPSALGTLAIILAKPAAAQAIKARPASLLKRDAHLDEAERRPAVASRLCPC